MSMLWKHGQLIEQGCHVVRSNDGLDDTNPTFRFFNLQLPRTRERSILIYVSDHHAALRIVAHVTSHPGYSSVTDLFSTVELCKSFERNGKSSSLAADLTLTIKSWKQNHRIRCPRLDVRRRAEVSTAVARPLT